MVREHNINTIEVGKLVCIFGYIVAKKINSKGRGILKAHVIRFAGVVRKLNVHEMRKLRQKQHQFLFLNTTMHFCGRNKLDRAKDK